MKRSTFTSALLAMAFGITGTAATARPDERGDDRRGNGPRHPHGGPPGHSRGGRDGDRDDHRRDDHRRPDRHWDGRWDGRPPHHVHGRPPSYHPGPGPDHRWRRGDRLPPSYRTRYYVVDDWRGHRLSAPPRGYHWVQVGAEYVLIAVATGIIAQVLLN